MTINTIELRELKADSGKVLTNGNAYSDVGGSVFLGANDNPENWYEITEEEYKETIETTDDIEILQ